jgi:hypothetical protein
MPTKAQVKAAYIAALRRTYPFYTEGSRALELAHLAADKALAGAMKLEGAAWDEALKECGLSPRVTLRQLAALEA